MSPAPKRFLDLPPELRLKIHAYVLSSTETTSPPQELRPITYEDPIERRRRAGELLCRQEALTRFSGRQKAKVQKACRMLDELVMCLQVQMNREPEPLDLAIVRTNRQIFGEIQAHIHDHVTMRLHTGTGMVFSAREIWVLQSARRLSLRFVLYGSDFPGLLPGPCSWSSQLHKILTGRDDIQDFSVDLQHYRSVLRIEECLADHGKRASALENLDTILDVLRRMPRVKASRKLRITWDGCSHPLPAPATDIDDVWAGIRRQLKELNER